MTKTCWHTSPHPERRRFSLPGLSRRQMLKRTAFLASAAAGAAVLGSARRGFAATDVESVLTMMGWAEYISPNNISKWEEMTGSTLIYDSYASNDEMYQST